MVRGWDGNDPENLYFQSSYAALQRRRTRILFPSMEDDRCAYQKGFPFPPHKKKKKQHFTLLISSSGWIVRIPEDMMKIFKTTNLGSIIGARRKTKKKKKILTGVQQIFLLPYSFCRRSISSYVWTNLLLPAPHRKRDRKKNKNKNKNFLHSVPYQHIPLSPLFSLLSGQRNNNSYFFL